ncbi:hypothetical protein AYX14_01108 [Cryptococcus neoformans]|nr:hypothetical protein AYX14_01108 [Cryptococcus neoformans var. grubii]
MSSNTPTPILVPFNLSSLSPQHWDLSSAPCPMNKQPGRPSSRPPSITGESQKRHALSSPLREGDGVSHKRQRIDSPEPLYNLHKPDVQQTLVMVINSFNDKLDSQERHFNHKLAEQETRWQTRFENLESIWVGKLALAELEVERSKTKATSIEMDLRERVGRLEGALAVLMRQSQDMPMPMGNISSIDYHTRGGNAAAFAPHGVATSSGQAHADLEQTLTPLWSREQAIEDLNEQQVVKIQPPDTVDDKIVVEIQDMSMSIDLAIANDEADTTLSGREHDHANNYFINPEDDPVLPTVSPQVLIHNNFTNHLEPDTDDDMETDGAHNINNHDHEHNNNDLWLPDTFISQQDTTTTVSTPLAVDNALATSSRSSRSSSSSPEYYSIQGEASTSTTTLLPASDGSRRTKGRWPPKRAYSLVGIMQEIVCDWCHGRCHWCCAGLKETSDMSDKSWLCYDCRHLVKFQGLTKQTVEPSQEERCIRSNCILLDDIKPQDLIEEQVFVVERLLGRRSMMRKGKRIEKETQYLVKWDGYGIHECSWEYRANLKPHDTKLVKDFEAALSREGLVSKNTVILLNEATSHWDTETGNPLVGA